jgi:hypothetical protein
MGFLRVRVRVLSKVPGGYPCSSLVVEDLMEQSGAAIGREMPMARTGVEGAVHEHMLDGLDR